ncbi:MAG: M23 family metallopeptidase [Clostridium sp.]
MFKRNKLILGLIALAAITVLTISPMVGGTNQKNMVDDRFSVQQEESMDYISPEGEAIGKLVVECSNKISEITESREQMYVAADKASLNRGGEPPKEEKPIMPVAGALSSGFGPRWGKEHKGIDIAASTGEIVKAFMPGVVTFSGFDNGGYGNLVIIDHGNGIQSYYGHNSKLLVKEGQQVSQGTNISEVGSTGRSTGPHLHFEIRKNGEPVNPLDFFK